MIDSMVMLIIDVSLREKENRKCPPTVDALFYHGKALDCLIN